MKSNPLISVILTSYNHGKYIHEMIESILVQSFKDFELIIIDDQSTDNSVKIINSFKDKRIRFFQNKNNLGMAPTVNKGIGYARGKFIAHANSDDIWYKNKLEKQVNFINSIEGRKYDAVFTKSDLISEKGKKIKQNNHFQNAVNRSRHQWLNYFFFGGNCVCYPSALIKRSLFKKIGLYDQRFSIILDIDMWSRICFETSFFIIQENLMSFRAGKNSTSAQKNVKAILNYEHYVFTKKFFGYVNERNFKKIFPNFKEGSKNKDLKVTLAQICVRMNNSSKKIAALNILEEILINEGFKDPYFSYKDYIRLRNQIIIDEECLKLKPSLLDKLIHPIKTIKLRKIKLRNKRWIKKVVNHI